MQRQSGILLHISSLPSPYGIGTMGREAREFVDFLSAAGSGIWQVLPIGPTSYGDSPYQSFSTYAGNPYFIDIDTLLGEGILREGDVYGLPRDKDRQYADYEYLWNTRYAVLRAAYANAYGDLKGEVESFSRKNPWLADYALFSALKDRFGGKAWSEWPEKAIRFREPEAVKYYTKALSEDIRFHEFIQYLFFRQWFALKAYANQKGILIFGDMPIYVAMDSADTWATPEVFLLDGERRPAAVAGVPPDYFTEDGQLWGNPLYDWAYLKKTGYQWWIDRMRAMLRLYDIVRIDHFIGFANYYAVPADAETARHGEWRDGPGKSFFGVLNQAIPNLPIVAEDLGNVTPKVKNLLKYCGFPGMKVLSFALDARTPDCIAPNTVLYTGTHDNDTVLGWWEKIDGDERAYVREYLNKSSNREVLRQGCEEGDICRAMIEAAYNSPAETVIIPIQDFLGLGSEARMNIPGTVGENWKWRLQPQQLTDEIGKYMLDINKKYGRTAVKDGNRQ
jgi:4-alpha-glucanotransferase